MRRSPSCYEEAVREFREKVDAINLRVMREAVTIGEPKSPMEKAQECPRSRKYRR